LGTVPLGHDDVPQGDTELFKPVPEAFGSKPERPELTANTSIAKAADVRVGSMLLKNDLKGRNEQLRFKRRVAHATSIQTTISPDSIVARSVFVAEFFNSIDPNRTSSIMRLNRFAVAKGWP
jgi:hypothetical protein